MRSPFGFSFTSLLKQQRRWEKTLTRAAKVTRKALNPNAPRLPRAKPAQSAKLLQIAAFGSNPGRLNMFAYAPPSLPAKAPLVVVLHGCKQDAAGYDRGSGWSALARERGFAVVYAEQTRSNNSGLCLNWFRPSNVVRDRGEVMSIRQMIAKMAALYGIDRKRVFITGLSAGGAMTAAMLACYPDLFAGGGIIAGLPYGAARDVQRALDAMKHAPQRTPAEWGDLVRAAAPDRRKFPPVSIWHGDSDRTVSLSNAYALVDQWLDVHRLDANAFVEDMVDGHRRRVWKDAEGRPRIEFYLIEGMGHGTPLKPRPAAAPRFEIPGPYMLDAGISSSRRLADGWGLVK